MNTEKYLPIGTIVNLKGAQKRIMIIGYCPVTEDKKSFDYQACLYPEGVISPKETLLFNHSEIETISYKGLEDDEYKSFNIKLKDIISNIEKGVEPLPPKPEQVMEVLPVEE